jgi:signal transduction histidine kinase
MDSIETVRLDEFIETTLTLLNSAIDQRSITIEKDFQVQGECVLLNGAALASTFLDLISNVVRTVEANGRILLRLASTGPDHVLCEISHKLSGGELYGILSVPGATSLMDMVKAHPRFMLAQRTVNACGGQLTLERSSGSKNTFRIVLPRNSLDLSSAQEKPSP